MTRPHPLTAMTEREWSQAWRDEQEEVDRLDSRRGSWLPNVIERRGWGLVRWTSGRPGHASTSGRAVAESYVILRPDVNDRAIVDDVRLALRDEPPAHRLMGLGLSRQQVTGAAPGAVILAVLATVGTILAGASLLIILLAAVLGAVGGAIGGAAAAQARVARRRAAVLGENRLRVVTGRYAPSSWQRLVESVTVLESTLPADHSAFGEADVQAADAVRAALWEAAGLLLTSSDHTGVEILADGVSRLARAHSR